MTEYFHHLISYSLEELQQISKGKEVFRTYQKNPYKFYYNLRSFWDTKEGQKIKIEVGNKGTIKINGKIVEPFEKKKGWFFIKICDTIEEYPLYRLVAETWCEFLGQDTTGWDVHHISNDGTDNTPENLIWINSDVHRKKI